MKSKSRQNIETFEGEAAAVNPDKVKMSTKLFYAVGELPGGFLTTILNFFLLIYLTDWISIPAGWAGAILFIGFVFDGITDPLAGYMSDRSKSKFGRRRIYMVWTALPLGLSLVALFFFPSLVKTASLAIKITVVLISYFIYILMYTYYTMPYFAIINDITDHYDERTSMMSWRMSLSILAILIAVIIPDLFGLSSVQTFSTEGFLYNGLVFAGLVGITGFVSGMGMRERPPKEEYTAKFSFKTYFIDSWKCAPFRQACLTYFCSFACLASVNTCMLYYLNYYLQLPKLFLPIAAGVMIIAIAFLPFWNFMCQKIGKKRSQIIGAIIISIGLLMMLAVPSGIGGAVGEVGEMTTIDLTMEESLAKFPVMGYIATIIVSCGFSALQMVSSAIVPDAINFSADKDKKNEGSYYGVVTFVFKIGTGIASLIIGLILDLTHYIEPPSNMVEGQILIQPASAQTGILLVFVALPCFLALLSILFLLKYNIDRTKLAERTREDIPAAETQAD
ncbi:MAG TPA: MFS transporter [Eubacteriales bacterium]|nr:MFS transporter [Eubacteriales bacterium]